MKRGYFLGLTHLVTLTMAVTFQTLPKKKEQFHLHPNKMFTGGTLQHDDHVASEAACVSKCQSLGDSCKSFLVWKSEDPYRCQCYSDYPSGITSTKENVTYGVKRKCSGVCKDLTYMNLCGTCVCRDTCENGLLRFYCDCRKEAPIKENCEDLFSLGFKRNGLFYINPDGKGHFSVSCVMKPKIEKNKELICEFVAGQHITNKLNGLGHLTTANDCLSAGVRALKRGSKYSGVLINTVHKGCYGFMEPMRGIYYHVEISSCEFRYQILPTAPFPSAAPMILMLLRLQVGDGSFWKRTVNEYKSGFGESGDNQWIGLEHLHRITTTFHTDIQVQMMREYPVERITTEYKEVKISGESDGYRLSYESFDSLGARGNGWDYDFDRLAVSKGKVFNSCSTSNWWLDCNNGGFVPTMSASYFGFGISSERFNSIAFFLVTKERI